MCPNHSYLAIDFEKLDIKISLKDVISLPMNVSNHFVFKVDCFFISHWTLQILIMNFFGGIFSIPSTYLITCHLFFQLIDCVYYLGIVFERSFRV